MVISSPPMLRVLGNLQPVNGAKPLSAEEIGQAFLQITTPRRGKNSTAPGAGLRLYLPGVGRLRCNAAQQRGTISLAIRLLPRKIPTVDDLELPEICKDLVLRPRGLVVVPVHRQR